MDPTLHKKPGVCRVMWRCGWVLHVCLGVAVWEGEMLMFFAVSTLQRPHTACCSAHGIVVVVYYAAEDVCV